MNSLFVLCLVGLCQAQYSHVRYQPEQRENNQENYRVPDIEGAPADSYQVPSYTYLSPPESNSDNTPWVTVAETPGVTKGTLDEGVPLRTQTAGVRKGTRENTQGNVDDASFATGNGESKGNPVETVEGAYYVLLPGSRLQRVQFRTESDPRNMAYTARVQYRDADTVPIFVYSGRSNAAYV